MLLLSVTLCLCLLMKYSCSACVRAVLWRVVAALVDFRGKGVSLYCLLLVVCSNLLNEVEEDCPEKCYQFLFVTAAWNLLKITDIWSRHVFTHTFICLNSLVAPIVLCFFFFLWHEMVVFMAYIKRVDWTIQDLHNLLQSSKLSFFSILRWWRLVLDALCKDMAAMSVFITSRHDW